jgi:orotidine-5'-phosphate decarboxylase
MLQMAAEADETGEAATTKEPDSTGLTAIVLSAGETPLRRKKMAFLGTSLTDAEERARQRVALALDFPSVEDAIHTAEDLGDRVGMFEVGTELHIASERKGGGIVRRLRSFSPDGAANVLLDLKLLDTPQTVRKASFQSAVPGVSAFNIHVSGGEAMAQAALEGAQQGAGVYRIPRPKVIGITVLTSLDDADLEKDGHGMKYVELVHHRTNLAKRWGLDGVVCPAKLAGAMEAEHGSDLLYVGLGIKWEEPGGVLHGEGHKQLYTADRAAAESTTGIFVIGSAITKAPDPRDRAYQILKLMAPHC